MGDQLRTENEAVSPKMPARLWSSTNINRLIIMPNSLIQMARLQPIGKKGLEPFNAVVEATVQRTRPVLFTALAAVLAFIRLTSSIFWGLMPYTLIGGTIGATSLIVIFPPALYAIWFKIVSPKPEFPIRHAPEP